MEQLTQQQKFHRIFSAFAENTDQPEINSAELNELVEQYPYCQSLKMIKASALKNDRSSFDEFLPLAALYAPRRRLLQQIIQHPETFKAIDLQQTVSSDIISGENLPVSGPVFEEADEEPIISTEIQESHLIESVINPGVPVQDTDEDITGSAAVLSTEKERDSDEGAYSAGEAEDDRVPFSGTVHSEEAGTPATPAPGSEPLNGSTQENQAANLNQEEKLILGNIAGADYFIFDRSAADPLKQDKQKFVAARKRPAGVKKANGPSISKYDDDKMPYTFLWWLQKTRKEYASTFQPYVNFPAGEEAQDEETSSPGELNQQIIENIFHLQTPVINDLAGNAASKTVEFNVKRKEDGIIERFITEEPQIGPLKAEKIDTENKARKSSEDPNDIISETLAQIYTDQMLYHKAIDAYKKLSLKFPEKSAYFAGRISELEKEIN